MKIVFNTDFLGYKKGDAVDTEKQVFSYSHCLKRKGSKDIACFSPDILVLIDHGIVSEVKTKITALTLDSQGDLDKINWLIENKEKIEKLLPCEHEWENYQSSGITASDAYECKKCHVIKIGNAIHD